MSLQVSFFFKLIVRELQSTVPGVRFHGVRLGYVGAKQDDGDADYHTDFNPVLQVQNIPPVNIQTVIISFKQGKEIYRRAPLIIGQQAQILYITSF